MSEPCPPRETEELGAPAADLPADFFILRLVLEANGTVLELNYPDMLVGRHSEADIRLPLPDVSRRHCRFLWTAGRWRIHDLNSLNGVHVNDLLVDEAVLNHGDRVRIGGFAFSVDLKGEKSGRGPGGWLSRLVRTMPRAPSLTGLRRAS
jgi:pSer/pThr/pTyr-binding forkhead associated (FHA) protein